MSGDERCLSDFVIGGYSEETETESEEVLCSLRLMKGSFNLELEAVGPFGQAGVSRSAKTNSPSPPPASDGV
jgi:hypothetical protein